MTAFLKSMVVAALVTTSVAQAQQAATVTAQSREIQLKVYNQTQEVLNKRMEAALAQAEKLGSAKATTGGYEIDLGNGTFMSSSGQVTFWVAFLTHMTTRVFPLSELAKNAKTPTMVITGVGGGFWLAGYLQSREGKSQLNMTEGEMIKAVKALELLDADLKAQRQSLISQADALGVKVDAKIVAYDGLDKLPQSLKSLGGGALNIN